MGINYKKNIEPILAVCVGLAVISISTISIEGIIFYPIFLTAIIWGVNYPLYKANFRITIIYNYWLLLLTDFLLREIPLGINLDRISSELDFLLFSLTFIIATIVMLGYAYLYRNDVDKQTKRNNYLSIITSSVITFLIDAIILKDF